MKPKRNKLVSLFLVFSLLVLSVNLYAKKRGADLLITKKDGRQIEGELITVKENSLLLLNTEGRDVSVGIADIEVIKIVKKSKVLPGIGLGFLIGAGTGAIIGYMHGDDRICLICLTAEQKVLVMGISLGAIGSLVGGVVGAVSGTDKTIQIEGMTDLEIQETMDKLRKKARIRDYK